MNNNNTSTQHNHINNLLEISSLVYKTIDDSLFKNKLKKYVILRQGFKPSGAHHGNLDIKMYKYVLFQQRS